MEEEGDTTHCAEGTHTDGEEPAQGLAEEDGGEHGDGLTDDFDEEEDNASNRKRKSRDEEDEEDGLNGLGFHMAISQEERQNALALKTALMEGDEDEETMRDMLASTTDMEFVQYAIIEGDNIPKCLNRMRKLRELRTTYQIDDTAEQGEESIRAFMEMLPGFSLNVDQCARHKHYVHVLDFAKFNPKKIHLPQDWKVFFRGIYYYMVALNPTLSAVRNGVLGIIECDGMGFHNFCIEFERRLWYEHPTVYPFRFHEMSWVRTPLAANVFHSLMKPIMSKEIRDTIHLGVKFDESFDGRLDSLFLQPTREIANERQVMTVKSFLEKRYHNDEHFRL